MSEPSEVPMICERCGGAVTEDDSMWSMSHRVYTHEYESGCVASLGERLTLTTQRAEAAEARALIVLDAKDHWAGRARKAEEKCEGTATLLADLNAELATLQNAETQRREGFFIASEPCTRAQAEEFARLLDERDALRKVCADAAVVFDAYASMHFAKGTVAGMDKSRANRELADGLRAALAVQPTTIAGLRVVIDDTMPPDTITLRAQEGES